MLGSAALALAMGAAGLFLLCNYIQNYTTVFIELIILIATPTVLVSGLLIHLRSFFKLLLNIAKKIQALFSQQNTSQLYGKRTFINHNFVTLITSPAERPPRETTTV